MSYPTIEKSKEWANRAAKKIPALTQTLAKGPAQYVRGVAPIYVDRAKGAYLWDVDGNRFLDYNMGIGPIVLGYCYEKVDEAIGRQLGKGITFSLMHPLEVEVAEQISQMIPNAESVRFSKTGADITTAAVRLSRAYTGRKKVAICGYHGWHDWYISVTDRNAGIPEEVANLTTTFQYNDIDSVAAAVDRDTACVILEPTLFEAPKNDFLHKVREICRERGALLIFDEMWTGFRLAPGGAQEFYDVKADLATFSKAIANGMPLAALTGRADVMSLLDEKVFFFTTFGGEALSLAAAQATMSEIVDKNVTEHIWKLGTTLKDGYNRIASELGMSNTKCIGNACRSMATFASLDEKSYVQQELIARGILWSGQHVISYSHTEADISKTLDAYREVLPLLKKGVKLRGEPIKPVFRTTTGSVGKK